MIKELGNWKKKKFSLWLSDLVRKFAQEEIKPKVKLMEEREEIDKDLIKKLFENGVFCFKYLKNNLLLFTIILLS